MKRWELVDYLIWGGIIVIAMWIIGKVSGIIQSPVWVEMIPYGAGIIAASGIVFKAVFT